jgi:rhodanese-related sulfurtransferase
MNGGLNLKEFLAQRLHAVVLDVLPHASFRSAHIPGAISLPVDEIRARAAEVVPQTDSNVIVYCASPTCPLGERALSLLAEIGYSKVAYFRGGLEEWVSQGHPLVSGEGAPTPSGNPERFLTLISALTIGQWIKLWFTMVLACGGIYWIGGLSPWPGLSHNGIPLGKDWQGFVECLYFSVVTATTVGYGDVVPVTSWARLLAATEAIGGMVVVGAMISRLLSVQQEKLLRDTHHLAFNERLGRMQTSLHLLIADFQDMESLHADRKVDSQRLQLRLSSGATILVRDLRIVRELLHEEGYQADDTSLELLLVTLNCALQSYLDALSICQTGQGRVTIQLGQVVSEICSECMPSGFSQEVKALIQQTESLGQRILDRRGET